MKTVKMNIIENNINKLNNTNAMVIEFYDSFGYKTERTITKIGALMDVSPVFEPAYSEASCTCRSLDRFLEDEKKKELIGKYDKMIEEIKNLK